MIQLQLLGGLAIDGPDLSPNASSRRRHPVALLALVAGVAPQAVGREKIMALLWPESDAGRASNSLRQTLFGLRRDLGEDLFLPESAGGLQLDPARVRVDLWEFREALKREAPGDAVEAYGGPFLDGFGIPGLSEFSQWVEGERERLGRQHIAALDALARQAGEEGRHDDAISWRRRQAAGDPFSSRAALALLKALAAAGDRTGALEYAGVYENLVRLHLEVAPDPAVTEFVASLRRHAPTVARGPSEDGRPPSEERREPPSATPADPPGADAVTERAARGGGSIFAPRPWLVAAAALAALGFVEVRSMIVGRTDGAPATGGTAARVVVLGSGATNAEGRDIANRIVGCTGPACPAGTLPQGAYIVPKHVAYATPAPGTSFISTVPDGTTRRPPGYECCTTATFESEFALPPDAVSARITVSVIADNQAALAINGVEFGRQTEREASWNYAGPPSDFSATFPPEPSGTNRLRVTLWNGGGAVGLQYHAIVTYETSMDTDGDGTSDAEDAFPNSDLRATVMIGGCDSGVANQPLAQRRGAMFNDLVAEALASSRDPARFAGAVSSLAEGWQEAGSISAADRGRIASCATGKG